MMHGNSNIKKRVTVSGLETLS